jgi:hypothetical protein
MVQKKFSYRTLIPFILFIFLLALSACQGQVTPTASNSKEESESTMPTNTAIVNPTVELTDTSIPDPSPTLNPTDTQEPPTPDPEVAETDTPTSPTETKAPSEPIGEVSFTNDVLPIFQNSCTRCHGSSKAEEGLRLNTYANVMLGSEEGLVIVAGDPDGSLLVQVVSDGSMPKRGEKLTPEEIEIIKAWILAGALDN